MTAKMSEKDSKEQILKVAWLHQLALEFAVCCRRI